jgi:spore maturation protein SpmB
MCFREGIAKGLRMAIWLLSIMVPISLAVTILSWTGALAEMSHWLVPVFDLVGLPAATVVAFLTGVFLNIYSAIAALGSIPLTDRQITILAVVMLISHNFPVEATVQKKTGSSAISMILLRLSASLVAAYLLNLVLPAGDVVARTRGANVGGLTFWPMLYVWGKSTAWLVGKVIGIIIGLMVMQRILKEFGVIRWLSKVLYPALWLLGLPRETAFLWIVANTLGLAYGSAVMIEETATGEIDRRDVDLLNRSIAICHSLLEDTLLFVAIGAWALWITLPRLVLAAAAVWLYRIWVFLNHKGHEGHEEKV